MGLPRVIYTDTLPDYQGIVCLDNNRAVILVCREQDQCIRRLPVDLFQSCVVVVAVYYCVDIAVIQIVVLFQKCDIAVVDVRVFHTVTFYPEAVIRSNRIVYEKITLKVFVT